MNDLFSKLEIFSSLKSCGLGIIVGAIFSIFGYRPPSPDNLAGILGVMGIFLGWIITDYYY